MYWRFTITGIVQGVGFRPFVKRLADKLAITGSVFNSEKGVEVEFISDEEKAHLFHKKIISEKPETAWIESFDISILESLELENEFVIERSRETAALALRLTPDFKLCDSCIEDLKSDSRRQNYPFTTCTTCGPRFAIAHGFPFDRAQLSIAEFEMCFECEDEYTDAQNRRFHSQTNSCKVCGPQLFSFPEAPSGTDLIEETVYQLTLGRIVAVQTTTGFLLMADATKDEVVARLRNRKNRPQKPFAVLYRNLDLVGKSFKIDKIQTELLSSAIGPIVLLEPSRDNGLARSIAPGLNEVGVMLPSTPLLYLISKGFGKPLIATSGNKGGSPLISNIVQAKILLKGVADYFLYHNLNIVHPMDDSVIRTLDETPIIIRPARGITPNYRSLTRPSKETVIAFGADMKGHYAFFHEEKCYLSPYFGDLESYEVQERMKFSLRHMIDVLDLKPKELLVDSHPGYFSRNIAKEFSIELNAPLKNIPHHHAHFCSVLADHNLFDNEEKILGIISDGVGYINDEKLGGAEFLTFENKKITPLEGYPFYPIIAGNKMAKETRLSLFSIHPNAHAVKDLFSPSERELYAKLRTSSKGLIRSIGRLFDAVSAQLGITANNSYEGEAAMKLEGMASRYLTSNPEYAPVHLNVEFNFESFLAEIEKALDAGQPKSEIILDFTATLAYQMLTYASLNRCNKVVCSGGVFQNALIVHYMRLYAQKFQINLYFNTSSSPNDSGIPIGQLFYNQYIN